MQKCKVLCISKTPAVYKVMKHELAKKIRVKPPFVKSYLVWETASKTFRHSAVMSQPEPLKPPSAATRSYMMRLSALSELLFSSPCRLFADFVLDSTSSLSTLKKTMKIESLNEKVNTFFFKDVASISILSPKCNYC